MKAKNGFDEFEDNVMMKGISDINLAAYLLCIGTKLIGTKEDNKKVIFQFEDQDIDSKISAYYNRAGFVDAMSYSEVLRNLKGLVIQKLRIK